MKQSFTKKIVGKWRMCMDFTDLCPKDSYLLTNIDGLIDGASKFQILGFIGAHLGYNQVRMTLNDA